MSDNLNPSLTIGIEEEYLLVDRETRGLAANPPAELMADCEKELGSQVTPEFLKSQIEIGTPVCASVKEANEALINLRRSVSKHAANYGLAIIAASTHPFSKWEEQVTTPKERYEDLARDLQGAVRRMLICGMHVHVAIEDPDLRIDVMNQVSYFLPHLLALSTSSPFWQGQNMGLKSYRLSVFDGMPRTGLPDMFNSFNEYQRLLDQMIASEVIEDATKLWWDVRPSARFPTLEMRVPDVCTRLEDAVTVAALYQCLVRMMVRLRRRNQRWRIYPRTLLRENRWLAQRYGTGGALMDLGYAKCRPLVELIEEILELVAEDAEALDCVEEVRRAGDIARRGTSADRQLERFAAEIADGKSSEEAFVGVVDFLLEETLVGT